MPCVFLAVDRGTAAEARGGQNFGCSKRSDDVAEWLQLVTWIRFIKLTIQNQTVQSDVSLLSPLIIQRV